MKINDYDGVSPKKPKKNLDGEKPFNEISFKTMENMTTADFNRLIMKRNAANERFF